MTMSDNQEMPVFACDLTALEPDQRVALNAVTATIFGSVQEVRERSTGYAFRLTEDSAVLAKLAEFITYDRLCCPFLQYGIEIEAQHGPIWLHVYGSAQMKTFILAEFGGHLNDEIVAALGPISNS